jgi:hypothetical protein
MYRSGFVKEYAIKLKATISIVKIICCHAKLIKIAKNMAYGIHWRMFQIIMLQLSHNFFYDF